MSVLDHQRQGFLPLGTSAAWALPPAPSSMSPCTPLAPHSCLSRFSLTRGKWQAKRGSLPCVCFLTAGSPWSTVFSYLFFLEMVAEHRPPTNWAFCPWPQQTSGSLREVDLSWGKELSTRELRSWDCVQLSSLLWPFYSGLSIPSRILETLPLFLSSAHTLLCSYSGSFTCWQVCHLTHKSVKLEYQGLSFSMANFQMTGANTIIGPFWQP